MNPVTIVAPEGQTRQMTSHDGTVIRADHYDGRCSFSLAFFVDEADADRFAAWLDRNYTAYGSSRFGRADGMVYDHYRDGVRLYGVAY